MFQNLPLRPVSEIPFTALSKRLTIVLHDGELINASVSNNGRGVQFSPEIKPTEIRGWMPIGKLNESGWPKTL